MGYTHYWDFYACENLLFMTKSAVEEKLKDVEKAYILAKKDIIKIIKANKDLLANNYGDIGSKPYIDDYIAFNGIGEDSHETFLLRDTFLENVGFHFCKTSHKPYDIVVVACLAVLKDHLKSHIILSGYEDLRDAWSDGVEMASRVLGRTISNPIPDPDNKENEN